MNRNNNPSIDPANNESLAGSIRFAFSKLLQQIDGALPARVIRYDREKNRVQVQLLITLVTTDNSQVARPQIASVPVLLLGGGGYLLSFPLNEGDLGWLVANDRDISLFLQSYAQSPPNTARIKNFSDGLFIPDAMRGYTIDPDDENNVTLQNLAGTVKITLGEDKLTLVAPEVEIDGEISIIGALDVLGDFTITGAFQLTGNMFVDGNIQATGTITPGV